MHRAAVIAVGNRDPNKVHAVVSGLFQAVYSLGDALGPIVGGNLVYVLGSFGRVSEKWKQPVNLK